MAYVYDENYEEELPALDYFSKRSATLQKPFQKKSAASNVAWVPKRNTTTTKNRKPYKMGSLWAD